MPTTCMFQTVEDYVASSHPVVVFALTCSTYFLLIVGLVVSSVNQRRVRVEYLGDRMGPDQKDTSRVTFTDLNIPCLITSQLSYRLTPVQLPSALFYLHKTLRFTKKRYILIIKYRYKLHLKISPTLHRTCNKKRYSFSLVIEHSLFIRKS